MELISEKKFPLNSKDYKLYEEVGEGVSATVYRALCIPLNEIVAIKVLDLEKCNNDLDGIRREVQTMILLDHPNVLRAHCSFSDGRNLWVVMPYMAGGSCLHIMKSAYPDGFEEPIIATLLREVLKALVYLHAHGHIHRDVKAGNILIDFNGAVKLADFGVSACMFDTGDRQRSRNTFVGTPCWMAPEVMQQLHGYDFKADIWSFGITALELAHGHAPFSKYPPMKVLLMTLQNAPPGLDYERDKKFSKSFKEMIAACLVKDPKKRPTSEKLLKHHFFKHARSNEYLARGILDGLSPLGDRFRTLKEKEADFLVQSKAMYGDKEHLSQQEYIRGISGWNFNLEDLKNQAALMQDYDDVSSTEEPVFSKHNYGNRDIGFLSDRLIPEKARHLNAAGTQEDELNELQNVENSLASFPIHPLEALKGCFDIREGDVDASSSKNKEDVQSESEQPFPQQLIVDKEQIVHVGDVDASSSKSKDDVQPESEQPFPQQLIVDKEQTVHVGDNLERSSSLPKYIISRERKNSFSGSLLPETVLSPTKKINGNGDREHLLPKNQLERNYSGTLYRQKKDANIYAYASMHAVEDASSDAGVQHKGRFKVTSSDLSPKGGPTTSSVNLVFGSSTTHVPPTATTASILQSLQYLLYQNSMQREQIITLMKYVGQTSEFGDAGISDPLRISPASSREKELQAEVVFLQQSIGSLVEELQRHKMQNTQLERQLNVSLNREEARERIWKEE